VLLSLMLLSLPTKAYAFDPLTLVGSLISPVFCKMINCKSQETIFIQPDPKYKERLAEMRNNFQWDPYYEIGDCQSFVNEEMFGTACFTQAGWRITEIAK